MNAAVRRRIRAGQSSLTHLIERLHIKRRFFLTYLMVLIAPLAAGMMLYPAAARIIESKEVSILTYLTTDSVSAMDQAMRHIDNLLVDLSRDTGLNRLLLMQEQPGYGSSQAAHVYDVHTSLSSRLSYAKLPSDIVLYIARPDLALDGSSVIYGKNRFYDMAVSYEFDGEAMPFHEFASSILNQYHYRQAIGPVTIVRKKTSMSPDRVVREDGFIYVQTLPVVGGLQNNLGAAVVHIGSDLLGTLSRVPAQGERDTFITDSNLNILTSSGGAYTSDRLKTLDLTGSSGSLHDVMGGKRMLITYARSDYNGWYCISASPLSMILRSLSTLRNTLAVSLLGILLLGVGLAFALSRSSARPYEQALAQLNRGGATAVDLRDAVRSLLLDHEGMRKSLDHARHMSREIFIGELIRGELSDDDAILDAASQLGLDLTGAAYCVAILALPSNSDATETDVIIILTNYISLRMRSARVHAHALPRGRVGLVLCFDDASEHYAGGAVNDLMGIIEGSRCYAGGLVTRPSFICVSYSEAEAALTTASATNGGDRLTHYREVARNSRAFVYPSEIETKMMLLCSGGERERLTETLNYLYEENFEKRSLSGEMAYALIADMYAALIKTAGALNLSWMPQSFYSMRLSAMDPQVEFGRVRACWDRLTELRIEQHSGESAGNSVPAASPMLEMEQYIRGSFASSSLSVSLMAERFCVSESYFSEYFKRATGQTFSTFLETTRINNACAMLRETSRTIEEIATDTGYTNALSFRRAFKKVTGVSPSDYRRGSGVANV